MARIIAVSNLKGGSGKTTTAVNLAAALANQGGRVLLVDTDPQAHATFSVGVPDRPVAGDLASVLMDGKPAEEVIAVTALRGVAVLPASGRLTYFERQQAANREARAFLDMALRRVQDRYDFILIDTPPHLGLLTVCSLVAAREIVIPVQAHVLGLRGLLEMVQLVYKIRKHHNPRLVLRGVIPTFYNAQARLSEEILGEIRAKLGEGVLLPPVRTNIALAEAPRSGSSIFEYRKQSSGAVDYLRVAHALTALGEPPSVPPPVAQTVTPSIVSERADALSHTAPRPVVTLGGEEPELTIPGRDDPGGTPSL